tara:strand:- start:5066 stop:5815 length:750 start_codon:yes stop_codon:yes gene_type:complete
MKHAFIPDTQIHEGTNTDHIVAAGNYLAAKQPDKIIMIGDWWDMPSLSSYDKAGSEGWEGKDTKQDFDSGVQAMADFLRPIKKVRSYKPKMYFCMGNHENRVARARQDPDNRKFKSFLSDSNFRLKEFGWKVIPFLQPVVLDGIAYAHYFTSGVMDRALGGQAQTKLKNLNMSFSMGHQQDYQIGTIYNALGERLRGLVCGSFYSHDEDYISSQGNKRAWRGMIMKHEVKHGDYDLMEVSLDYLVKNWS